MGRVMRTDPAVCPKCHTDFESSGKYRYHNLKNHMKNVHGITDPQKVIDDARVINNNSNCNINTNIDGTIASREDMEKLIDVSVCAALDAIMSNYGSVVVKLFDALHCNPEHPSTHVAVIPNKKKDEMLVVNKNGDVDILPKVDGAMVILDKLTTESKLVDKVCDNGDYIHHEMELEKDKDRIEKTINDIIDHLETMPTRERKDMEKGLRCRRRRSKLGINSHPQNLHLHILHLNRI